MKITDKVYTLDELMPILQEFAQAFHIPELYLFGSYARGEATANSDIDLLYGGSPFFSLISLETARNFLEDKFGKEIDLISETVLHENKDRYYQQIFIQNILKDRVRVDECESRS